ncbi:MAG: class I tRNA ligase family protein, partial [Nanoarchaeota archaeon]|nr:class I tRNA ligase family protein [Nanoarchaeota archaeon]
MTLNWDKIQDKWQKAWAAAELGKAVPQQKKEKFFMIFAYPGISGFLHVGHMRGFSYTDAICRYERLRGKEVLFPVGTHASGNQAIAFANKVKNKDKEWIQYLISNGCSKQKIVQLGEPKNVIDYFNKVYINDYWKKFGFLCDWDRFTCTTFPDYEKFIQWQFTKLMQKNLLLQKPYFATACIIHGPVAVDPSETDISKGGNAEKQEYTLLKFKLDDDYLVAATLRPETIYGQTNLWINPDASYVRVDVDGERWIMSREAAEKLRYQKENMLLKEDVNPREIIGRMATAPGINREIPILPAPFCNPAVGSGIVTSVPSDAPYDYVALKRLQDNHAECAKYNLNIREIKSITLIPIIKSKGYGDFPAQEIVLKLKITSLDDPQLEDATKEIYKAGHHTGVMRENAGKYAGMKVEEAKELVKTYLLELGKADIFHDLSEEVLCRCGQKVMIKKIEDQWFIRYSDQELTRKSKEHVQHMDIYPQEYYH